KTCRAAHVTDVAEEHPAELARDRKAKLQRAFPTSCAALATVAEPSGQEPTVAVRAAASQPLVARSERAAELVEIGVRARDEVHPERHAHRDRDALRQRDVPANVGREVDVVPR